MQASSVVTCLWPGLPRLWWKGEWGAFGTALGFAGVVNFGLLASFIWPHWLPSWGVATLWIGAIGYWMASFWHGHCWLVKLRGGTDSEVRQGLFVEAQAEYLKGHWFEAESLLKRLVTEDGGDVDAQLGLVALYRRTGRLAEAAAALQQLERAEGAGKWQLEIGRERQLLADGQAEAGPTANAGTSA